jgi:hypothetical protein
LSQLEKLWNNGRLLQAHLSGGDLFPRRLNFKSPDSKALANEFDAVRHWIAEIHKLTGFRVVDKTVRHRVIGENSLPTEVWIDELETAVALLHKQREVAAFSALVAQTQQRVPILISWVSQYPLKALLLAQAWPKLLDFVCWRQQHPDPAIYLRQVSLPGIDSKFIEQHRTVLASLLDLCLPAAQINQAMTGNRQFEQRYGFRDKPERIRFRQLDPELALLPGTDKDISITAADFQALDQTAGFSRDIKRVYITENEINFLAFPPQKNSLVIFGAGYGFDALAQADWLSRLEIYYWGDIDTHGFAILDQLRGKFLHVKSLLMDETTLIAHREFWGQETRPEGRMLSRLMDDELKLYQALLTNKHQARLRLEQERVGFDYLIAVLTGLDETL